MSLYNNTKFAFVPVNFNRNGEANLTFSINQSAVYSTLVPASQTIDLGTAPSRFRDVYLTGSLYASAVSAASISAGSVTATTLTGAIVPSGNLLPLSTSSLDIGSAAAQWKDVYFSGIAYGGGLDLSAQATTQTIVPKTGSTYDLGSNAVRWKDIYSDGNVYVQGATLTSALTFTSGYIDFSSSTNIRIGNNGTAPSITSGLNNIAIGQGAGTALTTAFRCVALGTSALQNNVSNNNHTAIGASAGQNTTGLTSTFLGYRAGFGAIGACTGDFNVALGTDALLLYTSGSRNYCGGYQTGSAITTGSDNVLIGHTNYSTNLTTGSQNTVVGSSNVASANVTQSIILGYGNTVSNTGNIVIGNGITTAANNTYYIGSSSGTLATGALSLTSATAGITFAGNVLIGSGSVGSGGTGNTIIGKGSGSALTSGGDNVIIGDGNVPTGLTTGGSNTIIGKGITTNGNYFNQVIVGTGHVVNHGACIIIAGGAVTTANSNRLYLGCASVPLSTGTTVGAAGGASALPATPATYLNVYVNGTSYRLPLYN